jgi:hypothetical protein
MKLVKLVLLVIVFQFVFLPMYGQEITLEQGSFKTLIAEKSVYFRFTYDSLRVGKYKHEADYVQKKVTEINKKYPGQGDAWALEWIAQRKREFEPSFTMTFISSSGKDTSSGSRYLLIFNTDYIEQGFSTGAFLVRENPEIHGELILVEASDQSKILAKAKITKAKGKAGLHFETGVNLAGAYAEAGYGLGAFILNN